MTDSPSRPPETPAAPEPDASETPVRPGIPEQAGSGRGTEPVAPNWSAAPGWSGFPAAPTPGWEWSNGWIPKPGIIPLRPLRVGEILNGSFALLRGYWRTVLPVTALVALVTQIPMTLILNAMPDPKDAPAPSFGSSADPAADLRKSIDSLVSLIPTFAVTELIAVIAVVLATAMIVLVISKAVIGRPAPLGEVWRELRPRVPQLLGLTALVTLTVGGVLAISLAPVLVARSAGASDGALAALSMLILPGFPIALWLAVTMLLAAPALVLERQGMTTALARSFRLVRGSWWRIFGVWLLTDILCAIAVGIISVPFVAGSLISSGGLSSDTSASASYLVLTTISSVIGSTVTLPVLSGVTALLYIDQRIRREALDLDLATAAGIPGYTHP